MFAPEFWMRLRGLRAAAHHEGKKNADHNDEDNREEDSPDDD
jgi:hypothetical protein